MTTADYLNYIVNEIHRTIVATVDEEGLPVTCAIDMMDCDEDSLYFLTAKGKAFYDRLINRKFLAFTAMKGEDTMSSVAVSVRGKVRELGFERIPGLFQKNPYMNEIYPTEESRKALTVFQIYEGSGEWSVRALHLEKRKPLKADTLSMITVLGAGAVWRSVHSNVLMSVKHQQSSIRRTACIAAIVNMFVPLGL